MFFFRKWFAKKGFIKPLARLLDNSNENVRKGAVEGFLNISSPKAIPFLLPVIEDESEQIRLLLPEILSINESDDAIKLLQKLLEDKSVKVSKEAALALLAKPDPINTWAHAYLAGQGSTEQKLESQKFLIKNGTDSLEALADASESRFWQVRASAITIIAEIKDDQMINLICDALEDEDSDVRRVAAKALGEFKNKIAIEPLRKKIRNPKADLAVRRAAAHSLAKYETIENLHGHAWMLAIGSKKEKEDAKNAFIEAKEKAYQPLYSALKEGYWSIRCESARLLGELKSQESVYSLCGAVKDPEWQVRESVAEALGTIGSLHGFDSLRKLLKDENWKVRATATKALGQLKGGKTGMGAKAGEFEAGELSATSKSGGPLGGESVKRKGLLNPIMAALRDENENVRANAAHALGEIGAVEAVDSLCKSLKDLSDTVRAAAATALGKIKDMRAYEPLIGGLNDWYSTVCHASATSLVQLGPPADSWGHAWLLGGGEDNEKPVSKKFVHKQGNKIFKQLREMLNDWHTEVRCAAAVALGEMGDKSSVAALCDQVVRSPLDIEVIKAVFIAFYKLKVPTIGKGLTKSLGGATILGEDRAHFRTLIKKTGQLIKVPWIPRPDKEELVKVCKNMLSRI